MLDEPRSISITRVIGDLPVPGIVVTRSEVATCRVTQVQDGPRRIRVELALLASHPTTFPKAGTVDIFDGWWVAVTFDDGTTYRTGDSTLVTDLDDDLDDDVEWGADATVESGLLWQESETSHDGIQVVGSRLLQVVGAGRMVSISSGWERVGVPSGTADLTTAAAFRDVATTSNARPPGWLTHMAYQPGQNSTGEVSYTMEWDWPSRLIRWVDMLPDGSLRAHVSSTSTPVAIDGTSFPSPDQLAATPMPERLPLTRSTFETVWDLARTTGRVPN